MLEDLKLMRLRDCSQEQLKELVPLIQKGYGATYSNIVKPGGDVKVYLYLNGLRADEDTPQEIFFNGKNLICPRGYSFVVISKEEIVGFASVTLNDPGWGDPFYSVDLIVSKYNCSKVVFKLLEGLSEALLLHYPKADFPRLPILIETKLSNLVPRYAYYTGKEFPLQAHLDIFSISALTAKEE